MNAAVATPVVFSLAEIDIGQPTAVQRDVAKEFDEAIALRMPKDGSMVPIERQVAAVDAACWRLETGQRAQMIAFGKFSEDALRDVVALRSAWELLGHIIRSGKKAEVWRIVKPSVAAPRPARKSA